LSSSGKSFSSAAFGDTIYLFVFLGEVGFEIT